MTTREELIEEAAMAIIDAKYPGIGWGALSEAARERRRKQARAALAVFEKAHAPTDDEREALASLLDELHDPRVTEGGCEFRGWNYGWRPGDARRVNADVVDPILASHRRSEATEPQDEPSDDERAVQECYDEDTLRMVFDALVEVTGSEVTADDCIHGMQNAGILFRERVSETQGEPSDAQLQAAAEAFSLAPFSNDEDGVLAPLRAALRAAGGVR
ncbi:hypothetical protein ACI7YT_12385 [Microbacterium sp. M]|uniref:hypothetical protein n=1 Tax=Microbacterium sp. M TaxID=3377125 RepID=UPI003867F8E7